VRDQPPCPRRLCIGQRPSFEAT